MVRQGEARLVPAIINGTEPRGAVLHPKVRLQVDRLADIAGHPSPVRVGCRGSRHPFGQFFPVTFPAPSSNGPFRPDSHKLRAVRISD